MKKKIATIAIIAAFAMPIDATACGICGTVDRWWNAFADYMEYTHCRASRIRTAQITNTPLEPCKHKKNHDQYWK
jgi:hypothetical protein